MCWQEIVSVADNNYQKKLLRNVNMKEHSSFPNQDYLVRHTKCPICSFEDLIDTGTPVKHLDENLHYDTCKKCNLIFMNPRPKQDWYNELYKQEFWEVKQTKKNKRGNIQNQIKKEETWAEKFIHILESIDFSKTNPNPKVLEIGCAYGVIVKLVSSHFNGEPYVSVLQER